MKNRWLIAAAAVGIHISIGSVYAWSVFNTPLETTFGWSRNEVALTFSLAIVFLGLSAAVMGRFIERRGPRVSGTLSACLWGLGMMGAGVAVWMGNLSLLWLTYGVIGGIGLGIGYITPVSTLVKWFPDHRGMATGLAIMGFGFGAMIGGPVFNALIQHAGLAETFVIMGAVYMLVMLLSASYLERPPVGWLPEGLRHAMSQGTAAPRSDLYQLTANEALSKGPFYGLWVMMFINIACGIAIIYSASPLAQETIGLSPQAAAGVVGLMALFNGLGRIGWASLSDYLGRPETYILFFLIQIVAFATLPSLDSVLLFQVVLYTILTCYGGGFATLPAYIGDIFGTRELGAIHGYVLTAWSAAGIAGPQLAAYVRSTTGSYSLTLYLFAGVFVVALLVSVLMRGHLRRVRAEQIVQAKMRLRAVAG